jgi:predicted dehydrogenase
MTLQSSLHLPAPQLIDPASVPSLRWGIFGTGWISEEFATSTTTYTGQQIVTVASRSAGSAEKFAAAFGVPEFDESYESLAARADIDVIYIATRPSDHLEHALIAINAGKHVLVEKPITFTPDDARTLFAAAKAAGVFIMEAMWNRYLPQASVVRQIIADGLIGTPELMLVDFCQNQTADPRKWTREHGTIMFDMGIYPISFTLEFLGYPETVRAIGSLHESGTEAEATVVMSYSSGARAIFTLSGLTHAPHHATIAGSAGIIEYGTPFVIPSGISLRPTGFNQAGETWIDDLGPVGHQGLSYEATAFAKFVADGLTESPWHPHEQSVQALQLAEEIVRQLGVTYLD